MDKILAGSKLNYKTTGTEYKELADVKTLPSLGGSINKEDATPINTKTKRYAKGLKDFSDFEFVLFYDNSTVGSNYRVARGFEEAGTSVDWQVEMFDGTKINLKGTCAVSIDGGEAEDVATFTMTIFTETDPEVVNPT